MQFTHTALKRFYLKDGPTHRHTPPKKKWWSRPLLIPPARREGELEVRVWLGPSRFMRFSTIWPGGTRTRNTMPLQAPGTEGSVGRWHTPLARRQVILLRLTSRRFRREDSLSLNQRTLRLPHWVAPHTIIYLSSQVGGIRLV